MLKKMLFTKCQAVYYAKYEEQKVFLFSCYILINTLLISTIIRQGFISKYLYKKKKIHAQNSRTLKNLERTPHWP